MCTAISYKTNCHYFGRNLDLEYSYNETVTVTPRNFPFHFKRVSDMNTHYGIIGMAYINNGYPLYYDAANEKGLAMAGLNFPENARYNFELAHKDNITPFELIPWILGQCQSTDEAKRLLMRTNIVNLHFSDELQNTPLHWLICDKASCIVVEPVHDGLKIYDNPVGVLTNNPPFDMMLMNLNNYISLSNKEAKNSFSDKLKLSPYSRGMGALGLPGDLSSQSRFVRAAFTKLNSDSGNSEEESICQFFHILNSVYQQRGCNLVGDKYEITVYSSCINTDTGIYYYTTYENSQISAVDMQKENLNTDKLISYPLIKSQNINFQNK